MRADRALALAAFFLLVTALLLPWWRLTVDDGTTASRLEVRAFRPSVPATTEWGPWLTGVLAAATAGLLFVRLAGNSHVHEPASWRRDLAMGAALAFAAAASCLLWPAEVPSFWGGRTYTDPGTGVSNVETATPGLGWWVALLAAALLAMASWRARRRGDRSMAEGTTPK